MAINSTKGKDKAPGWKVGALARQSGVSIRTLHHYDNIGLLSPSQRTDSGHRLYDKGDVTRLGQIVALRQMGFSLEEIRAALLRREFSPQKVVRLHITHLRERITAQQKLCDKLESLATHLEKGDATAEEFLHLIEVTTMIERYYTPEQLAQLEERRQALGEEHIRAVEAEWPQLMAQVQAHMDKGAPPGDVDVQKLARRWMELVEEFTGGDAGIRQSLNNMYENESNVAGMDTSPMRAMYEYIQRAQAEGA